MPARGRNRQCLNRIFLPQDISNVQARKITFLWGLRFSYYAIARDVKETLRKLKAAQYVAKNPGQVCPAKWNEGAKTITPSLDLVGKI